MLCFILDRPYRGRYFTTATPQNISVLLYVFRSSAPDVLPPPARSASAVRHRVSPKNRPPDSPTVVSQKLQIFIKLEGVSPWRLSPIRLRARPTTPTIRPRPPSPHAPLADLRSPLHPPRHLPLRRDRLGAPRRHHPGLQRQDHLRAEERRSPRRLVHDRDQHRRQQVPPRPQRHLRA